MKAIPQASGAILVQGPTAETVYDFGNARLYGQCDGQGRIVSASVPEGHPLQTMRSVRYFVLNDDLPVAVESIEATARSLADLFKATNSEGSGGKQKKMWTAAETQTASFDTAQALGRIWILSGHLDDMAVTVTTFMDESSPALFQWVQVANNGSKTRVFGLDAVVSIQFNKRYTGAGHVASGRVHAQIQLSTSFGATIQPWQLWMDKMQSVLSYALPVAPGQQQEFCLVTAAANDTTLDVLLHNWQAAYERADAYNRKLVALAGVSTPLQRSLIVAGLNAGLSAYKRLDSGVAGFLAGVNYAFPPRVYFRDSYWSAQSALIVQPAMVRDNLLWLARGINVDGSCPSAVWNTGLFSAKEQNIPGVLNWLPDHYDSPSFFVMLLRDYIKVSDDVALLDGQVNGRSLLQHAVTCLDYLTMRDQDGDGLFEKPRAANDWADNVMRDSLVTYDLALFYRALDSMAWLAGRHQDITLSQRFTARAERLKAAINAKLWDEPRGYYRNYQRDGFAETNLSIDSLLTVLYGIANEEQARRSLDAARQLLQTRNNDQQPYGDWGVMCCYPFYQQATDLFSISAEPYRYHNGADWPYWDGVYGLILTQRGDPDAAYVLTRWWELALEHGWLTPVEYWSPPHPPGSLLQGWSTMPAVALLYEKYGSWLHPNE